MSATVDAKSASKAAISSSRNSGDSTSDIGRAVSQCAGCISTPDNNCNKKHSYCDGTLIGPLNLNAQNNSKIILELRATSLPHNISNRVLR